MPIGDFPAGEGPLGVDPVAAPSAPVAIRKPPAAIEFNPLTGRFTMLDDGRFVEVHPVDQMVSIALGKTSGAWKSAPGAGHTLDKLPSMADPSFEASARDRLRLALRVPLARGDIRIDSITINPITDGPMRGRTEFVIAYFNLRSAQPGRLRSSSGVL